MKQQKTKKLNSILLLISFLAITGSCSSQKELITIKKQNECFDCNSCVIILKEIEPDSFYRKLLSGYIYDCLISGYDCKLDSTALKQLYPRNSFQKTVMFIYTDSSINKYNPYESIARWNDAKKELLYKCKDNETLHLIVNKLLEINIIDGLDAIFENPDLSKLTYLPKYLNNNDNIYMQAEIASIYHNAGNFNDRNRIMNKLSEIGNFKEEYNTLNRLFQSKDKIILSTFNEEIIGGY